MFMKGTYGQSQDGNFAVKDTIGVPHPYCITHKHVARAADHHGGMLNAAAIEDAEQRGAHCGTRGCQLKYNQHEQALLVECRTELKDNTGKVNPELHAYLLAIKDEATKNGYAGFSFVRAK